MNVKERKQLKSLLDKYKEKRANAAANANRTTWEKYDEVVQDLLSVTGEIKVKTFQGIAVLKAYPTRDGKTVVTESCPFCLASHTHGKSSAKYSHRVAHCNKRPALLPADNGSYATNDDGYYLELQTKTKRS